MEQAQFDNEIEQLIEQAQKQDVDIDSMETSSRNKVIRRALKSYVHGWVDELIEYLEGRDDIDDSDYDIDREVRGGQLCGGFIVAQAGDYEITVVKPDGSAEKLTFSSVENATDKLIDNQEDFSEVWD